MGWGCAPERLRIEGGNVLHGAHELALQEVQPLEGALVDGREGRERAVDQACQDRSAKRISVQRS